MAISGPVSITKAVEATPFPLAPNLCVSYPHFDDWKILYRPPAIPVWDGVGYRYSENVEPLYRDMKHSHKKHVLDNLNIIKRWAAGRAVFAALKARPATSVHIFPFDFLPRDDWMRDDGKLPGSTTEQITLPKLGGTPRGTRCSAGACRPPERRAASVDVFYTSSRFPLADTDGALLHELVHAMRYIWGLSRTVSMGGGYGEVEEFYANTIEMIYRSQKGLPVYDYKYHPFDPGTFLDKLGARDRLEELQGQQPAVFSALAEVDSAFNPIKQIANQ